MKPEYRKKEDDSRIRHILGIKPFKARAKEITGEIDELSADEYFMKKNDMRLVTHEGRTFLLSGFRGTEDDPQDPHPYLLKVEEAISEGTTHTRLKVLEIIDNAAKKAA
jgi:hypothetical protein